MLDDLVKQRHFPNQFWVDILKEGADAHNTLRPLKSTWVARRKARGEREVETSDWATSLFRGTCEDVGELGCLVRLGGTLRTNPLNRIADIAVDTNITQDSSKLPVECRSIELCGLRRQPSTGHVQ